MQLSQVPGSIPVIWGDNADPSDITTIPETTSTPGRASLSLGFPPLNFINPAAGGVPPFGQDFNGAFFQVYAWAQWLEAGGTTLFDGTFSTAVGGYPKGAIIQGNSSGLFISLQDNNTDDPNSVTTHWFNILGAFTGDSGSGGKAGYVPAPAAGDGAAEKVLLATGSWGQIVASSIANNTITSNKLNSVTGTGNTVVLQTSPGFLGNPTAPTPVTGDNDDSIATTAFVMNTLAASPTLGGNPTAPTPTTGDDDTSIATTAFVANTLAASPALGGNPTAPTQATGDSSTKIATTALVDAKIAANVYAGSDANNTSFPIGTTILIGASLNRNQNTTVSLSGGDPRQFGTGTGVSGTWAARGYAQPGGGSVVAVQRIL